MLLKRSISLFLAMILITQPITILGSENANSSDVLLIVDAQVFSAIVPTQLPVWMSDSGVITTANDVNITNTSKGPIRVDNIELTNVKADWELVNFDSDFSSFKVGSKKLAMSFNGDKSLESGNIVLSTPNLTPIDGLGSMPLNYEAKIPAQSTGLVDEIPANVIFTLGWDLSTGGSGGSETNALLLTADKDVLAIDDTSLLTVSQSKPSNVTWENSNPSVVVFEDVLTRSGETQKVARAIALGKTTIKVTDEVGNVATKDIIVIENELVAIKIAQMPNKMTYNIGDVFSPTGMKLKAAYKLGQEYDLRYYDFDETPVVSGQTFVLISYEEQGITKTVECPISVNNKPAKIETLLIDTVPDKTAYIEGENFDPTGMVIRATYDDGSEKIATDYILSNNLNLTVGQASISVSFEGKIVTQAVTVAAKKLTSIAITTPPNKTAYIEGNSFDSTGMVVTATYNNGTTAVINPTLGRNTNLTVGQTSVDISFGSKTIVQVITINSKILTSIIITSPPSKTSYMESNSFDATGMVVTANYNNGTNMDIADYVVVDGNNLAAGKNSVTISYDGKISFQPITVSAKTLTSIVITTPPNKTAYIEGNSFDSTDMVITATYNNGTTAVIIPTLGRNTNLTVGQTSVDVSFGGKTITQAITVVVKTLTNIEVTTQPTKTTYVEGNDFDATGMVVKATYNNNTMVIVTPTLSRHTNLVVGQTSIDVSYNGKIVTQAIVVRAITTGDKYVYGDYEYSYGQEFNHHITQWETVDGQNGWGVRLINRLNNQTDYESPLTTIQGQPVTNMFNLFYRGSATTLNLINWDTSRVTDMSEMFEYSLATSINGLNNFNTSNVTTMDSMFINSKATNLDLSSFNTSNVTNMTNMFWNSQATSIIGLNGFNTSNVTSMQGMFYGSQATNLYLSNFDTSKVTSMDNLFSGSQATSLDLSRFDTSKVTSMSWMLGDSKATNIVGLSGFDTSNVTNMGGMFYGSLVTNLNLRSFDTSKVTNMGGMFAYSKATTLDLSSFNSSKATNNSMFANSQVKNLIASTQSDADSYQYSREFPAGVTITVKA